MIAGSLNNWEYVPMVKVEDFCLMIDDDYESPIEYMVNNRSCAKGTRMVEELSQEECKVYASIAERIIDKYSTSWAEVLIRNVPF